jgi:hypothetical protein
VHAHIGSDERTPILSAGTRIERIMATGRCSDTHAYILVAAYNSVISQEFVASTFRAEKESQRESSIQLTAISVNLQS